MISQVERGQVTPGLGSLLKICQALDVPVGALFDSPTPTERLVRVEDRKVYAYPDGGFEEAQVSSDETGALSVYWTVIHPGADTGAELMKSKSKAECVYVLRGTVVLTLDTEDYELDTDACITFPGHLPRRCRNVGKRDAELLWMCTPADH
jgi:mannose-6-phosphate isomerase-like protein (cupin superfamily)